MSDSPIIAFYRGQAPDAADRLIQDIWRWSDDRLEATHDYIQWLFPLDEPSHVNAQAPLLTEADIATFRQDPTLKKELLKSLLRMLTFYGLRCHKDETGLRVDKADHFTERRENWLHPNNHNHLRITRILKSLSLLGLTQVAQALHQCLEGLAAEFPQHISVATLDHWRQAVPHPQPTP